MSSLARRPRRYLALVAALLLTGSLACGGDGDDGGSATGADDGSTSSSAAVQEDDPDTDAGGSDDGQAEEGTEGPATADEVEDGTGTTLSGAEICERLPGDELGPVLGLEIVEVGADDDRLECIYGYESAGGGVSSLTVAMMRSEDLGGLGGSDALDFVIEANRGIEEVSGEELVELELGDGAARMSSEFLHYGILLLGEHVLTVTVSAGDASGEQVDGAVELMATALA